MTLLPFKRYPRLDWTELPLIPLSQEAEPALLPFEMAIIQRYGRKESSTEQALVEMQINYIYA